MNSILTTKGLPTDNRKFEGYFQERLYAMDTVACMLIDGVSDPELGLSTLHLASQLAHSKAAEFMTEVEQYILDLESQLAAAAGVVKSQQ